MKKIIFMLGIVIMLMFVASCNYVPPDKVCTEDTDCTAAQCCHATEVVNNDNAPDCSGVLCTANCEPDTLDCGQAKARCVEGACTMVAEDSF